MALDLAQFRNLDPKAIGSWPLVARAGVIILVCVAVLGAGYWFDSKEQWASLERAQDTEKKLKQDFEAKQSKAVNLDAYRQQMTEMEDAFGTMLRQLPSKTEVADLLVDVSQTGLAAGLEFELFKPGTDVPLEFYAEMPIDLKIAGTYHSFGEFVSGVAALPRIVTLHDINITKGAEKTGGLLMQAKAKTYRYLDEEEIEAARKAQAAKQPPKKGK